MQRRPPSIEIAIHRRSKPMTLQCLRQAVGLGVRDGVAVLLINVGVAEALKRRVGVVFRVFRPRDEHNSTIQFAFVGRKVFLAVRIGATKMGPLTVPLVGRRPCDRDRSQR
jgi:hypothetical protein